MPHVKEWISTFARRMRTEPDKFIVDEVDHDFYLVLDCQDGEDPATHGTCDALVCHLLDEDADPIRIACRLDEAAVVRLFDALNLNRLHASEQKPIPRGPSCQSATSTNT